MVAQAFIALEFTVPIGPQRFTMHVVRNVGGHAVFVHRDLKAAAHFLGDSIGSVEGVYAALKGELVDTSMLEWGLTEELQRVRQGRGDQFTAVAPGTTTGDCRIWAAPCCLNAVLVEISQNQHNPNATYFTASLGTDE